MSRNIEIKARLHDLPTFRKRVVELPASGPELLFQRDTFYSVLQGRLKLREFADGTSELIYYQRPDKAGPKTSKYTRTPIADATPGPLAPRPSYFPAPAVSPATT
jgi:hypothetical protein